MPEPATTVTVAGNILGRVTNLFGGPPREKSACDVISEGDLAEFLSGTSSNPAMRRVIGNRRSDFEIAFGLKSPPSWSAVPRLDSPLGGVGRVPGNAELAQMHLDYYLPICRRMEGDNFTVEGGRGGQGLATVHRARDEFMMAIRQGRLGTTSPGGGRSLTGGDPGPARAGGVQAPSPNAGTPLTAGFGNVPVLGLVLIGAVVLFGVVRTS